MTRSEPESHARKARATWDYDDATVLVHSGLERADPTSGGTLAGGYQGNGGGVGGPLSPVAVEAFTEPGSRAQIALIGRNGGRIALAIACVAAITFATQPVLNRAAWVTLAIVIGAAAVGSVLVLREDLLPLPILDLCQITAAGAFVGVAAAGGPLPTAIPYVYVLTGTTIFVVRRWPAVLMHTTVLGAAYAGVLAVTGPVYAPVTRWVAVMGAVVLFGLFVRWLVSTAERLASAERKLSQRAAEASEQLAEVSRAKTSFLARMSHELRTPLNVIVGFSELLGEQRAGPLSKRHEGYVADIAASAHHLVSLVDDVLDIAQVESGDVRLDVRSGNVRRIMDEAIRMVRERAVVGQVELVVDVDDNVDDVECDERKVLQVVVNLLANAVKFTPPGGRVVLSAWRRSEHVHVAVTDTGVGIAEEDLERVFEAYAKTTQSVDGFGLGLPLARRFIELHGGSLTAVSEPGQGSTFTFQLPMRPQSKPTDSAVVAGFGVQDYSAFTEPGSLANRMLLARVGSWMSFLAAALLVVFAGVTPVTLRARGIMLLVAVLAALIGVVSWNAGRIVSTDAFEAYHIGGIAAISAGIALLHPVQDLLPLAYAAVTMTTFALSPLRRAIGHFALVVTAYGIVLLVQSEPHELTLYLSVVMLLSVSGIFISWYVDQVRRLVLAEQWAHRRAEEVLAQLAATSKHKSDFLANMSHELRTPLNAIIGFSDLLGSGASGKLNKKQQEYVEDIRAAAAHLLALINDILDLARLEAEQVQLTVEPVAVSALLERVVAVVAEDAQRKDVDIVVDADPEADFVAADHARIEQALTNLMLNAIKFTPSGGRVEVLAIRVGDELRVAVHDNGIGILPEQRESIFEAFHQGPPLRVDELPEGPGLGLALARGLVQLHGGRIWVDSEPGCGSTFTIAVPGMTEAPVVDVAHDVAPQPGGEPASQEAHA